MKDKIINPLLLLLTAIIWGSGFVAQSVGMNFVQPFTFNFSRCIVGGIFLAIYIMVMGKGSKKSKKSTEAVFIGGLCCGLCLFGGMTFQQIGIQYTEVGKAGFLTAMYIVLVPVLSTMFLRKKTGIHIWLGVVLAVVGIYLLSISSDSFTIAKGDIYEIICALLFALHILVIDYFNTKADPVKISCVQFFVCGILSGVFMMTAEQPQVQYILAAWQPILYAGIVSTGIGYTLQVVGQRNVNPTVASLILSLESVVSAIAGLLILDQQLTQREIYGCICMFAAIVLAQLPIKNK